MIVLRRIFDLVLLGALVKALQFSDGIEGMLASFFSLDEAVQAGILGMAVVVCVTFGELAVAVGRKAVPAFRVLQGAFRARQ